MRDWQAAGVFEAMHQAMLAHANSAGLIDFDRVIADASHVRAKKTSQGVECQAAAAFSVCMDHAVVSS